MIYRRKIKELSSLIPDLNPIKNLWLTVKMKLYKRGKLYNSKTDLREAIKNAMSDIKPTEF